MKRLVKNRVNIFDKLAVGISFVPLLCFCTMFTYYFNEGLVINGENIASDGMFYVMKELIGEFFRDISLFHILGIAILLLYQVWFIFNIFMTKTDKRRKKKTHDLGLFVLCVLVWASVLLIGAIMVLSIWNFEWIMAFMIGLFVEYQPTVILFLLILFLALLNIIYNVKLILSKGMNKYLKECENNDYQFTDKEMFIGLGKIFVVLLFSVIVAYKMILLIV